MVREHLGAATATDAEALAAAYYPEPVEHCDVCRWWRECDARRRSDDHLSLVANISRLQIGELQAAGVATLAGLGTLPDPLPLKPRRGALETFVRVRDQARVQLAGRERGIPVHELLPVQPDAGLARLPLPSPGDIFLDLEGAPFAGEGGLEYLFGIAIGGTYTAYWARSVAEERVAFETVVDRIVAAWSADPGVHVYHYASYEPAAFKRLMGRHATREAEIDRMLRAGLFVDLYAVVRRALRASVEHYSIKDLEPFYQFDRDVDLRLASAQRSTVERALEIGAADVIAPEVWSAVEGYNRDDCFSAQRLRDWLEALRTEVEHGGVAIPRPTPGDGQPSEALSDRQQHVARLAATLVDGVPADRSACTGEQHARWLLADLLDWHRREDKAPWWEFFRLRDLSDQELFAERAALSGLSFVGRVGGTKKCPIDRYTYPPQDTDVGREADLHLPSGEIDKTKLGTVAEIDRVARWVEVKKVGAHAETHPTAVFAHSVVDSRVLADALVRIAEDFINCGLVGNQRYRLAAELLLGCPPRINDGTLQPVDGESVVQHAVRLATSLQETVLPIQGPPGSGKTFTGARMICELVRSGMRVGVTAVSHKVIRNLLDGVMSAAAESGITVSCLHKVSEESSDPGAIEETTENKEIDERFADGSVQLVGGTAWLWARPQVERAVDVLFVDEAGQMSLANVLAVSQAARSLVLLGDPQQLEQPQQGSHPEGADVSALEHILGGHQTIPADRGLFLAETWRLAPSICDFTSEIFYEGRLQPRAGLERQVLVGTAPFEGAGLWLVPVTHEGNQSSSLEEVEAVERIVEALLVEGAQWIDMKGNAEPLSARGIRVIAPYNAQVSLLGEKLGPRGIEVGTVDKFQGQEAPVVIYSMATSTREDAPRGMEFLYSLNRLNVATSRARCACILVASPRLLEPECKTPRQMRLANALCRYAEMATTVRS